MNDQIDAAYREKYRRYPDSIINSVLNARGAFVHDRTGASCNTHGRGLSSDLVATVLKQAFDGEISG